MGHSGAATVVVLGSLHLDVMVQAPGRPRLGETMVGQSWSLKPGGKGGNQAVAAAAHGARAAMVGAVGDDEFGQRLCRHLSDRGVDIGAVAVRCGAATGMSVAIVEPSGDYGAVIVSGVNSSLNAACITPEALTGADWLVLQNEVPDAANLAAAMLARDLGARVLLNAAPARPLPSGLAGLLDVLVVNALEAEALCTVVVTDLETAARAASALTSLVTCAIVTAGGDGMALAARDGTHLRLPAHRIDVVSTHGAGDCFVGALAARLAGGATLAAALRYANAAAALLVATPDPQRDGLCPSAVETFLARE